MNKKIIKITISSFVSVLLLCCVAYVVYALTHKKERENNATNIATMEQTVVEVDTMVLCKQTFQKQILCNGKLVAIHRAELMCPKVGELLKSVNVKNGQRVSAGMVLALRVIVLPSVTDTACLSRRTLGVTSSPPCLI